MKIFAEAGKRDRRTPGFLSRKEVECPRCGRIEYGNVSQECLVMCSLCLIGLTMGKKEPEEEKPKAFFFREKKPVRKCERCGESFRGRSNRQRFCDRCQNWARKDKVRELVRNHRKRQSAVIL